MVEVSLTVGKLDASLAVLLTKEHHLIEFPTILLPNGVKGGSIVKIKCEHDLDTELQEKKKFQEIQDEIFTMFGKNVPKSPRLGIRNVTQTLCVLQWEPLDLGTASFKSLVLYRDNAKLFSVPNPLSNRTTKLSGLAIDKLYSFQLRLDTTAGVFHSEKIEVTTHKMTDLSGINVCVQDIVANEQFTLDDINEALKSMGAHSPAHDKMRVDTTHYITTRENKENPEFIRASEMNVPIIRPEWLKACERERRIVGVLNFYVKDCALPTIIAGNYWANSSKQPSQSTQSAREEDTAAQPVPSVKITELSDTEVDTNEQGTGDVTKGATESQPDLKEQVQTEASDAVSGEIDLLKKDEEHTVGIQKQLSQEPSKEKNDLKETTVSKEEPEEVKDEPAKKALETEKNPKDIEAPTVDVDMELAEKNEESADAEANGEKVAPAAVNEVVAADAETPLEAAHDDVPNELPSISEVKSEDKSAAKDLGDLATINLTKENTDEEKLDEIDLN